MLNLLYDLKPEKFKGEEYAHNVGWIIQLVMVISFFFEVWVQDDWLNWDKVLEYEKKNHCKLYLNNIVISKSLIWA